MTTTKTQTVQDILTQANPVNLADVLRLLGLGRLFAPVKVVVAAATATATWDITTAAFAAAATTTITGIDAIASGAGLPAIGAMLTLRVSSSGTANSVGTYILSDVSGTPLIAGTSTAVGVATISNDGKTLVFPNTITGFVLEYTPRPEVAMTAAFEDFI